jgi:hypothetical protein
VPLLQKHVSVNHLLECCLKIVHNARDMSQATEVLHLRHEFATPEAAVLEDDFHERLSDGFVLQTVVVRRLQLEVVADAQQHVGHPADRASVLSLTYRPEHRTLQTARRGCSNKMLQRALLGVWMPT